MNKPFLSPSLAIPHLHSIFESWFCVFWGCQIINHTLTGNSSWSTHLGKFVLCLFQQQQSFRKNYPDDLHMMQGSLRVTIHLSWKPCVFSAHLLSLFAGWETGMVQEWKENHKTLALWFGELVIEQKNIWSKSPSCHMSLMDTEEQQVPVERRG